MRNLDKPPDNICIIGDNVEAQLLSTLFAIAGHSNVLVGNHAQTSLVKSEGKIPHREAGFSTLLENGQIKSVPDINQAPFDSTENYFLTNNATPSEVLGHENVIKRIAREIKSGCSLVYTGLCPPGYTMEQLGAQLHKHSGLKIGEEIGLGYMPFTWCPDAFEIIREKPRIFSMTPSPWMNRLQQTLLDVFPSIRIHNDMKVVETAALYESVSHEVAQALQLELAITADRNGVDFQEVLRVSKPIIGDYQTNIMFQPGQSVASSIILQNLRSGVIRAAKRANDELQKDVLNMVKRAIQRTGRPLRTSRIAILGPEWFSNIESKREVPSIVKLLARKCASVTVYPTNNEWTTRIETRNVKVESDPMRALTKANCALVALPASWNQKLDAHCMALEMSRPGTICDLTGVMIASNVEQAGLFYASLGRGASIIETN